VRAHGYQINNTQNITQRPAASATTNIHLQGITHSSRLNALDKFKRKKQKQKTRLGILRVLLLATTIREVQLGAHRRIKDLEDILPSFEDAKLRKRMVQMIVSYGAAQKEIETFAVLSRRQSGRTSDIRVGIVLLSVVTAQSVCDITSPPLKQTISDLLALDEST
jgi:hypothetical protein